MCFTLPPISPFHGAYSRTKIDRKNQSNPAVGMMYTQKAKGYGKNDLVLDFTLENNKSLHRGTKLLPAPVANPDVFTVNGVVYLGHSPSKEMTCRSFMMHRQPILPEMLVGVEVDAPANLTSFSIGVTANPINTNSYTGRWTGD